MKEFSEISGFDRFTKGYYNLLQSTLSTFFSAPIALVYSPIRKLRTQEGIDITEFPLREVYIKNTKSIIISYVKYNGDNYYLAVVIKDPLIGGMTKLLNMTAKSMSVVLGRCVNSSFTEAFFNLDEALSIEIVSKFVSKGYYNQARIKFLIRYLQGLRSTTFEGRHFSTGFILTKSLYD